MNLRIDQIMNRVTAAVPPDTTIEAATRSLLRSGVQELYITAADGSLLGVVPDYELLKARLSGLAGDERVESLMTRQFAVLAPETGVTAAACLFRDCRYVRVAVAREGRLLGQVSRRDVLRALIDSAVTPAERASQVPDPHCRGERPRRLLDTLAQDQSVQHG